MGTTYFIADTHFGDSAICRYENRPFETIEQIKAENKLPYFIHAADDGDIQFVFHKVLRSFRFYATIITVVRSGCNLFFDKISLKILTLPKNKL